MRRGSRSIRAYAMDEGILDAYVETKAPLPRLAGRAHVRPSLRDNTFLDGGTASKARFPLAPEHSKTVLMRTPLTTGIPVVCEGGATVLNRLIEDDHDSLNHSASRLMAH